MKKRSTRKVVKEQPRKDSKQRRVNYDNARVKRIVEDVEDGKIIPPMKTRRSNDIRWYSRNPSLLQGSSNLTFYNVAGSVLPMVDNTSSAPINAVPGVMSLSWNPYLGGVDNEAINQAANSIYSFTVHANSRNTSYTAPDQMMTIMAGASVFSMIALGIRAYGVMKMYDGTNMYLPNILLKAMGFDPDSLRENYSHMWYDLNNLIAQSKQIWIPNTMPVIERWFWMNSHIYMDGMNSKSQYYVFTPHNYLSFSETGSTSGTSLNYTGWFNPDSLNWKAWPAYLSTVQTMIDNLIRSEDRGVIFGDILKAYGAENLYAVQEIDANYTVVPEYDTEVLSQIENLCCFYQVPKSVEQDQNTNVIVTKWNTFASSAVPAQYMPSSVLLNFHGKDAPTPEQIMIATRLTLCGLKSYNDGSNLTYVPYTAGTEIIYTVAIWSFRYKTNGLPELNTMAINNMNGGTQSNAAPANSVADPKSYIVSRASMFDWHPILYVTPTLTSGLTPLLGYKYLCIVGDLDNYTVLDKETLRRINNTAIYSEFGVPYLN